MRINLLVTLLASLLLITGCVQMHVTQKLYRDNTVDMSVTFSADEKVLSGFRNMTINPSVTDKFSYNEENGSLTYSFKRVPFGAKLFKLDAEKETSFFGIEDYTVTKEFKFPYYYYTYALQQPNLGATSNPQAQSMLKAFTTTYSVESFAKVFNTSGNKTGPYSVDFTLDPSSTAPSTATFREWFFSSWFG